MGALRAAVAELGVVRRRSRLVMKTAFIALGIGVAVEVALLGLLAVGGFGPCGPASPLSGFVFFVHTPGFSLLRALHIGSSLDLFFVPGIYAAIWSGLAFLILHSRSRTASEL